MVGAPYNSIKCIEDLLENTDIEVGSIHYDSPLEDNIVGYIIKQTESYTALNLESIMSSFKEYNTKFYKATGQFGNLYMTLNIS